MYSFLGPPFLATFINEANYTLPPKLGTFTRDRCEFPAN